VAVTDIYKSPAGKQIVEDFYRKRLQHWPVPNRQVVVPTCEGDTFVVVSGEGHETPIVLFHGSGSNSMAWTRDIVEWSRHHRVYSVDLIGEPGLSAPSRPPLTSDRYARWLDDVWSHFGLASASVVGLSLGGWMALDYAVRRPERVRSLSLISPSGIGRQNGLFFLKVLPLMLLGRWGRRAAQRVVAGSTNMPRQVSEYLATIFQHFRPRLEKIPVRSDGDLAALRMPVQVIVGARDVMLRSDETRDRVMRTIPGARITYLEHAGHILPPQTQAILDFIDAVAIPDRRETA
jgi:pimeloyl-ACP methyl ester carboxylesterase